MWSIIVVINLGDNCPSSAGSDNYYNNLIIIVNLLVNSGHLRTDAAGDYKSDEEEK